MTEEEVAGALNFYCCYGAAEEATSLMGVPTVTQELTSPFDEESIEQQRAFYGKGLTDDQFFDVVKQGRLLMPMPIDNPPGDRNPSQLLSHLRQRLYVLANAGNPLSFPVRELFVHNGAVRTENRTTAALQLPTFATPSDPSLNIEQREKLLKMQRAMWVLFGEAVASQGAPTVADIHGWDSPFGAILLLTRTLLFSAVGSLWKTWEYHVLLAYFAAASCQPHDKKARALGNGRVNRAALGRFLWVWSVIERKSHFLLFLSTSL